MKQLQPTPWVLSPASRLVTLKNELALLEKDLAHLAEAQYSALEAVTQTVREKQEEAAIELLRLRYEALKIQYAAVYDTSESITTDINALTERETRYG